MRPGYVIFALVTLVLLTYGLYQGMHAAPTEQTMGDVQRIFYYHVPAAWVAFFCFFLNFLAGVAYLAKKRLASDAFAVSAAEVGVVFCTINLVTGPLWARPVWGIWWTWDVRLTSTLVLWLIYVSYLLLRRYSSGAQMRTVAAVLGIFGFLNVPFVYLSIRYFRTQHPQPVIGGGEGSGLHPDMWYALMANTAAFLAFALLLLWTRYRLERVRHQVEEAQAAQALAQPATGATP
jgi:heme exporter protein C